MDKYNKPLGPNWGGNQLKLLQKFNNVSKDKPFV